LILAHLQKRIAFFFNSFFQGLLKGHQEIGDWLENDWKKHERCDGAMMGADSSFGVIGVYFWNESLEDYNGGKVSRLV